METEQWFMFGILMNCIGGIIEIHFITLGDFNTEDCGIQDGIGTQHKEITY